MGATAGMARPRLHNPSFHIPLHLTQLQSAQRWEEEGIRSMGTGKWLQNILPWILIQFFAPHHHPPTKQAISKGLASTQTDKQADGKQTGHSAKRAQKPHWTEKILSHMHQGRPGASMLGLESGPHPQGMQPSHPGLIYHRTRPTPEAL